MAEAAEVLEPDEEEDHHPVNLVNGTGSKDCSDSSDGLDAEVFMDRTEFEALENFHSMVLHSSAEDDDDPSRSSDVKLELELAETELAEAREEVTKARTRITELEELLRIQESITRDEESKRQSATIAEKRAEEISAQLSERLTMKDAELYSFRKDTDERITKLNQQVSSAVKDKEAMVMRYAQSEKEVIIVKRDKENLERKLNDMNKEKENLLAKLKNMSNDKAKLAQSLDTKTSEVFQMVKEAERLKEEIVSRDVKIKWGQNKLKSEMDAHQETKLQLEKSYRQLQDLRDEANQVRVDCQNLLKSYHDEGSAKPASQDEDIKQIQELHDLKGKHASAIDENLSLSQKIQKLETERLDHEQSVAQLKDSINQLRKEAVQSRKNAQELEHVRNELIREQNHRISAETEVLELKAANDEVIHDMSLCRQKEAELLEFSATLTEKNVVLQSNLRCVEAKLEFNETEITNLRRRLTEHYVLKDGDNHQAIVPENSDRHKAQMARYGGIMASVYSSRASDGSMTLELSLEINRKLQAILEDTLLKNITLKENLNTLGDEIARLTQQHQKKQKFLETRIKDLENGCKNSAD
ncbi:unnamed protein product [Notodromas monacha]|uniref:Coiled-coil domain-containing protein 186 n=1 Tax=Notodromas monacha TaxID=399045 RepID=A0A7R9GAU8_9CRUS|nr:unnamed protein product [Notodromas monacha]CAG0915840.1 unnamed protein product [Notodromas monacha]